MRQITTDQFKAEIRLDPAWASKLTEPAEITDFCDMSGSEITHLSPLLHFSGIANNGDCANFFGCKSLKVAEGRFEGFVYFWDSGIEKIGELFCGKDNDGNSADFYKCKSLKIAEGKFEGFVSFWMSGIKKIGDLSCGNNNDDIQLSVENCTRLTKIPITFNPKEVKADPKLLEKLEVDRFIQKKREEIVEIEL